LIAPTLELDFATPSAAAFCPSIGGGVRAISFAYVFDNGWVSKWLRNDPERESYAPRTPQVRHVWVDHPGGHGPPAPGLVIAWRIERQPSSLAVGWSAQVAVVWALDRLSVEWVSAEKLRPVREQAT
jgi:hypothetical protein